MRRYKVKCDVWSDFHELHQRVSGGIPIRHLATTVEFCPKLMPGSNGCTSYADRSMTPN